VKIKFLTLAQQEVDEAFVWFDERAEGKGLDFLDELDRVLRLVKAYPLASIEIEPEIRRCLFARLSVLADLRHRRRKHRRHRSGSCTPVASLLG
jgi:hypothetical protein